MLRPVSLSAALAVVATLLVGLAGPAQAQARTQAQAQAPARAAEDTPLTVTIDTLSPMTLPRKGPIRVSGTLTNQDDQTWTTVNLYAFVSATPMTTREEIAAAAELAPESLVGERILETGTYDTVDEIEPGQTVDYTFSVPRSAIAAEAPGVAADEPGVYWFGVHALGFNDEGGDNFADGRARTFLPLVPDRTTRSVEAALVIPVRRQVTHAPDGSITNLRRWTAALQEGGALGSLVDLGATAGAGSVSWLVDPAVVDAVRRLAAGNPPRSLAPTISRDDDPEDEPEDGSEDAESGSPDASPSVESSDGAEPGADDEKPGPRVVAAAAAATAWLDRLQAAIEDDEILTLPYGDVDVAAAAEHDPDAYRDARKRSSGELEPWGLATSPAVAPPGGYLDADGIRQAEPGAAVLVTDRMLGEQAPTVVRTEGRTLVVTSSGAASGGPGPDAPLATVAVRQRIAAEAAVRLLSPGQQPLVVAFPQVWSPEADASFFSGLEDLGWLDLTTVASVSQRLATEVPVDRLDYPEEQAELELDAEAFTAADELVTAGETLQNLLTLNDQVAAVVRDEAFTDLSYADRADPFAAAAGAGSSRIWIETRLRSVRIDAPKAVILSSGSGRFAATVTNDLEEPVSVRIRAVADAPLEVSVPTETIELNPDSAMSVLLNASSSAVGIRNLTLLLTDVDDVPLGSSEDLPIRSNRVSNVIWLIIGTGIALLLGAIAVRLFRRVRAARRT